MAEGSQSEELQKVGSEAPEPDPIADRSMSGLLLIFSLFLIVTLVWALFDEVYGQRPWKSYQKDFVELYTARLQKIKGPQAQEEKAVKASDEYVDFDQKVKDAHQAAAPRVKDLDDQVRGLDAQLADISPTFQDLRARIAALNYKKDTSTSASGKASVSKQIESVKNDPQKVTVHVEDGSERVQQMTFKDLEARYNDLSDQKAKLTAQRIEATKPESDLIKQRDDYLKQHLTGLTEQQVAGLMDKMKSFDYTIKQINLAEANVVDRCESCHAGVREPLTLTAKDMGGHPEFVSHPDKDLLKIHDPERFGCSTCHGGNGRATTSVEKGHGNYEHWLWPLYKKENTEAGCNQCHDHDRVLAGAEILNAGKDLFYSRGCYSCHRYEGFDRETDALSDARNTIKQLDMEKDAHKKEIQEALAAADKAQSDEDTRKFLHRADDLRQTIGQLDARIDQLDVQSKYLMQDQKKFGPNLKEIKLKLRKEWIPVWLKDPQAFRPATKMPAFRLEDDDIKAISAYLWQNAVDGPKLAAQTQGDAAHGKDLFKSLGCMACHSIDGQRIDQGSGRVGGTFAADLSRVGEKANYDYIVRWVHNPRERSAPYCPTEKRDLTPDDYTKHGLPFVFDSDHSKCPNDGHQLQVQNTTVMPNFRLADQDVRDIATFLMGGKKDSQYPDASFMDDSSLKDRGAKLIRTYGCAGCHEIRGMEDEGRIGTELTKEGSKPIERLDFALLTQPAEDGVDPINGKKGESWYDHKGFFEHKLANPAVYDFGKDKAPEDRLKMPNIYLEDKDITALTTFLLGSVDTALPDSLRYNPAGGKKNVQDGWWVVKKYNCMGCHNVLIGQDSILMGLQMYQGDAKEGLPPRLTSEGARVNPDWLLGFLKDPSLSGAQSPQAQAGGTGQSAGLSPQPGLNRNGVRGYLKVRMPTFNFSPNELQALVNFFMGASSQAQPYIPEKIEALTAGEQDMGRALFTSQAAPCLKCHMTGDAAHDSHATAPNFLLARERLKPAWTERWVVDPALLSPGTSMPSGLFKRDPALDRWVLNGPLPPSLQSYDKDHVSLLVRYMFQISADEQRRLASSLTSSQGKTAPPAAASTTSGTSAKVIRRPASNSGAGRSGGG